jgi:hypothetical protein
MLTSQVVMAPTCDLHSGVYAGMSACLELVLGLRLVSRTWNVPLEAG